MRGVERRVGGVVGMVGGRMEGSELWACGCFWVVCGGVCL